MNAKIKKQFDEMKAKHPDTLLLFRSGNFYEAIAEDAAVVADLLGIIITDRKGEKVAAFPAHALDEYLPKLVRSGRRVAMCDQLKEPEHGTDEPATASQTSNSSTMQEVKNFPTWEIKPSPMNPRKTFDEEAIKELAASIRQHGLLQPITVRPKDGMYEIVMGERRYRAYCLNQQQSTKYPTAIPCIVREMTDEEALDAMITENLQRKDVDPMEEAFAFGQLLKTGKTIEQIADRFGKSKRFIQERIKLDNLLPELKSWVTKGWMNIGAAMHICKLTEEEQRQFLDEYTEEEVGDDTDPITKQDAEDFTDDLFMKIERSDWHRSFEGSCKTTCEKCPFNNANVGCLFYEMKPHDATCTNRERWDNKRASWLHQLIDDNASSLIMEGESLETGKTLIVAEPGYYADRCADFEPLLQYVRDKGYKIAKQEDYFERFSHYREDDERLQEKLANNEVYRCLCINTGYRGTEINVRYYEFKKSNTEESGEEVEAMNLVNEYKENERKNISNTAVKLRDLLKNMEPGELPTEPLTQTESLVLMTLILCKCSYKFRSALDVTTVYGSDAKVLDYAKSHTEQVHQICRDFIREELGSTGVEYNADLQECQRLLLDEWAKEATEEVVTDMAAKLAKKQTKIEERLTALGYNTDGTKMES